MIFSYPDFEVIIEKSGKKSMFFNCSVEDLSAPAESNDDDEADPFEIVSMAVSDFRFLTPGFYDYRSLLSGRKVCRLAHRQRTLTLGGPRNGPKLPFLTLAAFKMDKGYLIWVSCLWNSYKTKIISVYKQHKQIFHKSQLWQLSIQLLNGKF